MYLLVIAGGAFAEAFVRQPLIANGDAAATARNILSHEQLYRWAFAENLIYIACNIGLAVIFYRLFARVNGGLALLSGVLHALGKRGRKREPARAFRPAGVFGSRKLPESVQHGATPGSGIQSLRLFDVGFSSSLVFFGLYCVAIGILIYRSTFLPRLIGVLMAIGGVCYVTDSLIYFIAPQFAAALFPYILLPSFFGEASLCLWLTTKGVDVRKFPRSASDVPSGALTALLPWRGRP